MTLGAILRNLDFFFLALVLIDGSHNWMCQRFGVKNVMVVRGMIAGRVGSLEVFGDMQVN